MLIDNINNFSQHDSQGLVLLYTVASETASPVCLMRLHESEDVVKALMGQAMPAKSASSRRSLLQFNGRLYSEEQRVSIEK